MNALTVLVYICRTCCMSCAWWLNLTGESGLGKSTLINSMFLTDIYNTDYPGPSLRGKKTVEVVVAHRIVTESLLLCGDNCICTVQLHAC